MWYGIYEQEMKMIGFGYFLQKKVDDLLTNIPTNDITELNDLIYPGVKLVREKVGDLLKTTERKSKPGWELRLE